MPEQEFDYYRDTTPEEFLADLRAILADGDNTKPNRLIEEINWMTAQFMAANDEPAARRALVAELNAHRNGGQVTDLSMKLPNGEGE